LTPNAFDRFLNTGEGIAERRVQPENELFDVDENRIDRFPLVTV
jgi:hypothetical protein